MTKLPTQENLKLAVIELPLEGGFGETQEVCSFDINAARIAELKAGEDRTWRSNPKSCAAPRAVISPPMSPI